MPDNRRFYDVFGDASLNVFSRNFAEFLSHYIDLSTRVKTLYVNLIETYKCFLGVLIF